MLYRFPVMARDDQAIWIMFTTPTKPISSPSRFSRQLWPWLLWELHAYLVIIDLDEISRVCMKDEWRSMRSPSGFLKAKQNSETHKRASRGRSTRNHRRMSNSQGKQGQGSNYWQISQRNAEDQREVAMCFRAVC